MYIWISSAGFQKGVFHKYNVNFAEKGLFLSPSIQCGTLRKNRDISHDGVLFLSCNHLIACIQLSSVKVKFQFFMRCFWQNGGEVHAVDGVKVVKAAVGEIHGYFNQSFIHYVPVVADFHDLVVFDYRVIWRKIAHAIGPSGVSVEGVNIERYFDAGKVVPYVCYVHFPVVMTCPFFRKLLGY